MDNKQKQQTINVDLSQAETFACKECDSTQFNVTYLIKRLSPLMSPTGDETFVPVQVFCCGKCGVIPENFLPSNE